MTHGNDDQQRAPDDFAPVIPATDFVATVIDAQAREPRDKLDPHWWSESDNGRCSEDAALFAASQPAPLNIV